ncbi:MAG: hypothetical protein ACRD0B_03000 [Acidimicrobiales bacterium]
MVPVVDVVLELELVPALGDVEPVEPEGVVGPVTVLLVTGTLDVGVLEGEAGPV